MGVGLNLITFLWIATGIDSIESCFCDRHVIGSKYKANSMILDMNDIYNSVFLMKINDTYINRTQYYNSGSDFQNIKSGDSSQGGKFIRFNNSNIPENQRFRNY